MLLLRMILSNLKSVLDHAQFQKVLQQKLQLELVKLPTPQPTQLPMLTHQSNHQLQLRLHLKLVQLRLSRPQHPPPPSPHIPLPQLPPAPPHHHQSKLSPITVRSTLITPLQSTAMLSALPILKIQLSLHLLLTA